MKQLILLGVLSFFMYSLKAQSSDELQKIRETYKTTALKKGGIEGSGIAGFDPFKIEADTLKARFNRAELRVEIYLLKNPEKKRSYLKNGSQYYIKDIRPDGTPLLICTKDRGTGDVMKASTLYNGGSFGLNIQGQNMVGGIWDGGLVRVTHELYQGRALKKDNAATLNDHMCHVTGDMIGGDIAGNAAARGIAFNATAWCYFWDDDVTEYGAFGAQGYLLSNHSYGRENTAEPIWSFGAYDNEAASLDNLLASRPKYLQCWAGGNEQETNNNKATKFGYDVMSGTSCSKNILTVGAVNSNGTMNDFSNWGPTDDGRIKPDICAQGVQLTSSYSAADNTYATEDGTSFASPSVAGLVLLLQQYYKTLNPEYMDAAGVKGLIMHTASDLGQPGPDYKFGWGNANAENAANAIMTANADFSQMNSLSKIAIINTNPAVGASATYTVKAKGGTPLSVSICWTDDAGPEQMEADGIDPVTGRLIYNFDIVVTAPNGTTMFYPWSGPGMANRTQNSTRSGPNNVDNFKRVDIDNPVADGIYTITISKRTGSPAVTRNFTMIATGLTTSVLPVNFTFVKAYEKGQGIQVEWNIGNELNIKQYDIEKSSDGRSFAKFYTQQTRNIQSIQNYSWLDAAPNSGYNYYRIKAIEKSGDYKFSQVVNVKIGKSSSISFYPNPIKDNNINLQLNNQPKGKYSIRLINQSGQEMYRKEINHIGGSATETLLFGNKISKGVYNLQVKGNGATSVIKVVME